MYFGFVGTTFFIDDGCEHAKNGKIIKILYGNIYDRSQLYKYGQILNKNTSPYFHGASLAI